MQYSYSNNNPTNYTDPTGHCTRARYATRIITEDECEEQPSSNHYTKPSQNPDHPDSEDKPYQTSILEEETNDGMVNTLKFLATATQDIATIIDLGFAVPEVIVMLIGLSGGPETIPVVVSGMDIAFNVSGGNAFETAFSLFSLIFTASADYLDDGEFGEDTNTSMVTFLTGTMMPDPLGDLAIDGYASGYNHRIFNGFDTILNGGGLFK